MACCEYVVADKKSVVYMCDNLVNNITNKYSMYLGALALSDRCRTLICPHSRQVNTIYKCWALIYFVRHTFRVPILIYLVFPFVLTHNSNLLMHCYTRITQSPIYDVSHSVYLMFDAYSYKHKALHNQIKLSSFHLSNIGERFAN